MKHSWILALVLVCLASFGCSRKSDVRSYVNPLMTADSVAVSIADPFIYEYEGKYYLTGTTTTNGDFTCYTSNDMITWTDSGPLFTRPENHIGSFGYWAPEVHFYDGKFYLTYSCYIEQRGLMLTFLAVSDNPDGPFVDLYAPWFDPGHSVIDANIFVDDDGTPYVYYSKNETIDSVATGEIYAARLKRDLSGLDGEPVFISKASQPWEKVNWARNRCNEGATVLKHNGRYYMTYSGNDTGYEHYGIGVQVAESPLGPWVKYDNNPIMTTDLEKGISSPGHNSIVTAPDGNMYIVYHRHADPDAPKPSWDRVLCIDKLYFENDSLKVDGPTNQPVEVGW